MQVNSKKSTRLYQLIGGGLISLYLIFSAVMVGWGDYLFLILIIAGCQSLLAISFQLTYGMAGMLSLAQVGFFGLGSYLSAFISLHLSTDLVLHFLLISLVVVPLSYLLIRLLSSFSSHSFALATLAFSELLYLLAIHLQSWTGGANGLYNLPSLTLLQWTIDDGLPLLVLVWLLVSIALMVAMGLKSGLKGFLWQWLEKDRMGAENLGVPCHSLRVIAFTTAAVLAAVGGLLQSQSVKVISPQLLQLPGMIFCLVCVVLGGKKSSVGSVIGVLVLSFANEWLRDFEEYHLGFYGLLLVLCILLLPNGLAADRKAAVLIPETPLLLLATAPQPIASLPSLSLQNVGKRFGGVRVLEHLSFTLQGGHILGIIGANGSGKTTLINILSGAEHQYQGNIRWNGKNLAALPLLHRIKTGIVRNFQSTQLLSGINVLEYIALAYRIAEPTSLRWPSVLNPWYNRNRDSRDLSKALTFLEKWGLSPWQTVSVTHLNSSQVRLLEILRTAIFNPRLLLLDEPMGNLAEPEQLVLQLYLKEQQRQDCIIIIADHHIPWLFGLADQILWLGEPSPSRLQQAPLPSPLELQRNELFQQFFAISPRGSAFP